VDTLVLRSVGGVVAGALVAAAGYFIAAVAALLLMHGIPLGSQGGPPTPADVSTHLTLATAAAFCGGRVAVRIARFQPSLHAAVTGGLLATFMFLGFSKPASNWPAWFPYGMAVACAAGAVLASRVATRRSSSRQRFSSR
jgi:hypothetical protein